MGSLRPYRLYVLAVVALSGCASMQQRSAAPVACGSPAIESAAQSTAATEWQRTELYFGLSIPGGGEVSESSFGEFVGREICARFPAGFSLVAADGAWRSPKGDLVREQSRILLLLHPRTARDDSSIEAIRAAYRSAFHQDSVLRVDEPAQVSF